MGIDICIRFRMKEGSSGAQWWEHIGVEPSIDTTQADKHLHRDGRALWYRHSGTACQSLERHPKSEQVFYHVLPDNRGQPTTLWGSPPGGFLFSRMCVTFFSDYFRKIWSGKNSNKSHGKGMWGRQSFLITILFPVEEPVAR